MPYLGKDENILSFITNQTSETRHLKAPKKALSFLQHPRVFDLYTPTCTVLHLFFFLDLINFGVRIFFSSHLAKFVISVP